MTKYSSAIIFTNFLEIFFWHLVPFASPRYCVLSFKYRFLFQDLGSEEEASQTVSHTTENEGTDAVDNNVIHLNAETSGSDTQTSKNGRNKRENSSESRVTPRKRPFREYSNLLTKAQNVADSIRGPVIPENEFDVFGKNVAIQLKNMPMDVAIEAEMYIQNYLSTKRLECLRSTQNNAQASSSNCNHDKSFPRSKNNQRLSISDDSSSKMSPPPPLSYKNAEVISSLPLSPPTKNGDLRADDEATYQEDNEYDVQYMDDTPHYETTEDENTNTTDILSEAWASLEYDDSSTDFR